MPERGRHHQRSDVYDEDKIRDRDHPQNRDHTSYDGRGRHHKTRDVEERGSAGDRRVKQDRQRDMTPASHERPAYRDQDREGPSRLLETVYFVFTSPCTHCHVSHITICGRVIYLHFYAMFCFCRDGLSLRYCPCRYREPSVYRSEREYDERQHRQALYNLRYVLTSRGLCQLMELFVNLLIIICAGVPYSNNGGYRDLASLGGIYYYHFGGANAFTGADADRVKELDRLFHQLKRPPYVFAMASSGVLLIYACTMLALGVFRVPYRWPPVLLGEALLNFLIGLGYIPALAFFFIKLQGTYNDPICTEREQMYKSKGHKGFECQFHGADIAAGLFGVLGVFVFIFGSVLAVRAFRSVRELKKQRTNEDNHF